MKRLTAWVLALGLCVTALSGYGKGTAGTEKEAETGTAAGSGVIRVGGLKGPTSMGMVGSFFSDSESGNGAVSVDFTMAVTADELTPKLLKGELDVLAVPANLASILYQKSEGSVQFAAISTLGVLYIVEKGGQEITSVADLKGKTIYATGKGNPPEYTLNYLLSENGLDPEKDVTIEWKSEPTEVVALLAGQETGAVMLPQPFVTVAEGQVEGLAAVLDLTEEWEALGNRSRLITAGLLVRREFAEEQPELFQAFLETYRASSEYLNTHVEEGAALVEKYGIVKAAVAKKAIPACNVTYIDGEEMKEALSGYLEVLYGQNPKAVGGALPGDDFYY